TITVDPEGRLNLISPVGTDAQILCENTPIALIEYQLLDGATGATVTGLPAGIGFNVLNGIVTISGTPIVNITTSTVYSYTIATSGSPCSGTTTGTITIDPDDDLSLISAVGTDSQVLCEGDPINSIIYQFSAGATSANITGLPLGVTFTIIGDLVTISGTPTDDITTTQVYPYTITTIGACTNTSLSGTITVDAEGGLVLTSPTGTDSQILCEDSPITQIEYQLLDGATGAIASGLPTGLSFSVVSNIVTISGTPTVDITVTTVYNYSVTTTGSCSNSSLLGTITLEPNDDLELISVIGTDSQVLCETEPLSNIIYEFSGGATSATVTGLPAGITFVIAGNQLIISGTPTDNITNIQVYPYTISTLGGTCQDTNLNGTITVNPEGGLVLTSPIGSDAQVVCENSDILDITYQLVDGATGATVTGLPAGISFSFVSDIITMSGFPTVNITSTTVYNYTITTTGTSCSGTTTGTITVDPDDDLALISPVGSESQVLCEAEPLIDIVYEFSSGATSATVSGLPAGVNFVIAANQVTIFGTPTANITTTQVYPYTVTTLGGTCQDTSLDGTITVNPEGIITLTSPIGTDAQVLCETEPITAITYQLFDGATDATATGLPTGVSFSVDLDIVTISGTPTDDITSTIVYDYTITTTGGCSNTSLNGTITVNPDDDLAIVSIPGTDAQILCETEPLVAIVYEFSAGATSAAVTGLPAGVTFVVVGNELTISGTPSGPIPTQTIFDYTVTTIGTCSVASLDGTITVNPEGALVLTSPIGSDAQVLCENTTILDITYQLEGDATNATVTGLPAGLSFSVLSGIVTISGTPSVDITSTTVYDYTITTTGSPCSGDTTGTITLDPDDDLDLISTAGTDAQILCETEPLVAIVYEFSAGATSATVAGLPAGVTFVVAGNELTISGTPTGPIPTQTTFNYTVTTQGGNCSVASLDGTITVNPEGALVLTSPTGSDAQVLCENTPIDDITYQLDGDVTNATVTGLPVGISFSLVANIITISGTPTDNITTTTVFNYTITTTGESCSGTTTGTITLDPDDDLDLISTAGTDAQILCETEPLVAIVYEFSGGASSATVTGLPAGVTFLVAGNELTISGTPTANITTTTVYPYTVTTLGGICLDSSLNGTITVNPEAGLQLTPGSDDAQVLCENTPILDITYQLLDGATGATVTGLPAGISFSVVPGLATISGTPTVDITTTTVFNYTVSTTGSCINTSLSGTITLNPDDELNITSAVGTDAQILCETEPLVAIVYEFSGGASSATVTGLPAGVTFLVAGNELIISGTPTANITTTTVYTFTVTTLGGICLDSSLDGTITVNPEAGVSLSIGSDDAQVICENTPILPIDYQLFDGATDATVTGLPAGVSYSVALGIVRISGTPTVDITATTVFSYTVTTAGSPCNSSTTGTITIDPDDDLELISPVDTDSQVLCEGEPINDIIYQFSGGAISAVVTGLPAGVTFVIVGNELTISGTPTDPINTTQVYPYTVTTSGTCLDATLNGTITVDPEADLLLNTPIGTDAQVVCENTPIQPIQYQLLDGASGATVTGLPTGVTFIVTGGGTQVEISGTPTANVTAQTLYNFTVTTTGSPCNSSTTGTITVDPDGDLELVSLAGSDAQVICEGEPLADIIYQFSGGATGGTVTGLPPGVNFAIVGSQVVITGTPIGPFAGTTTFNYTVTADGGNCSAATPLNGTITVGPSIEILLNPGGGSDIQEVCEGEPIQDIIYDLSDTPIAISVEGLPLGIFYTFNGSQLIISGFPTDDISSQENFTYTIETIGQDCDNSVTGEITVNPDDEILITSAVGSDNQIVCENLEIDDIVYELQGGSLGANVTGLPTGVSYNLDDTTGVLLLTISGIPTIDIGINTYVITTFGLCSPIEITGTIEVLPAISITHDPVSGPTSQVLCQNTEIEPEIIFFIENALNVNVSGLPDGCNYSIITDPATGTVELTIFGSPTQLGVFDYLIETSGLLCDSEFSGTLEILENSDLVQTSDAGTEFQTLCEGEAIESIIYEFSGAADSVNVVNLPTGVNFSVVGNQITISGTPTDDITTTQTYSYTVSALGGDCSNPSLSGTITVNPQGILELISASGTENQVICESTPIVDIEYELQSGATGVDISGLPSGLNTNLNPATGILVIFGTPDVNIFTQTVYPYVISTTGSLCNTDISGSITIDPNSDLIQTSDSGTESQILCEGDPLVDIVYEFSAGATGANVFDLPPGVNFVINGTQITINGTPTGPFTETTLFTYSVETLGSVCDESILTGTITVGPSINITLEPTGGPDNQELCEADELNPLQPIIYNFSETPVSLSVNGLPLGISYAFDTGLNQLIISGFPTENISVTTNYIYTITTIGQVCENSVSGEITVNPADEISLISDIGTNDQIVCDNSEIVNIVYELEGGSIGATVTGLPTGVSYNTDDSSGALLLTISGTVVGLGIFNYDITTFGLCENTALVELGTIEVIDTGDTIQPVTPNTTNQSLCLNNEIDPIVFIISDALFANVSGLPNGCTYTNEIDPTTGNIILEIIGAPLVVGTFNYIVESSFGNCNSQFSGIIDVIDGPYFDLLSGPGTEFQEVCENSLIDIISYQLIGNYDNFTSVGLAQGIDASFDPITGIITISGQYDGPELTTVLTIQYTLYASSPNGCLAELDGEITVYPAVSIADSIIVTEISPEPGPTDPPLLNSEIKPVYCYGSGNGAVNLVLSGGSISGVYTYSWSGPNSFSSINQDIENLLPGTYTVDITDVTNDEGCGVTTESFIVTESDEIIVDIVDIILPSCDSGLNDGEIQLQITGGDDSLIDQIEWYTLDGSQNCFNYSISPIDLDFDGIPDYGDSDLDGDGSIDPGLIDVDNDGIIDSADPDLGSGIDNNNDGIDDFYLITTLQYFNCDLNIYETFEILNVSFIGSEIIFCAGLNTMILGDPTTLNVQGGTNSCSAGSWELLPQYSGLSAINDLSPGIYKVEVNNNDLDGNILCTKEEIFQINRDSISYDNLAVDFELCELTSGYLTIDVYSNNSELFFYYDNQIIDPANIAIINSFPDFNTYEIFISNPLTDAPLEIINEFGCGVIVDEEDTNWFVPVPEIQFSNPEYDQFGSISIGSSIIFESTFTSGIETFTWNFGDGTPLEFGPVVTHAFNLDGIYIVTLDIYSSAGCTASVTQEIRIGKGYTIMLPNVFTPNSDNFNELFRPLFTGGILEIDFQIFDPDGHQMYYENSVTDLISNDLIINGWDGENAKATTPYFIYKVKAKLLTGEEVIKTGLFKILR
ncbi:PKD domain-containing protein, partial [Flavobacteriaceae bacterium]|nr:PKD domain-containing protein [Flavobacteriaceae bacterium]